ARYKSNKRTTNCFGTELKKMAIIKDITTLMPVKQIIGNALAEVNALCIDSRNATAGCAFIALKGTGVDGHAFIEKAIAQGASVIVCENLPPVLHERLTYIHVADSAMAAGMMASAFYGYPSQKMKMIGVTGTNG